MLERVVQDDPVELAFQLVVELLPDRDPGCHLVCIGNVGVGSGQPMEAEQIHVQQVVASAAAQVEDAVPQPCAGLDHPLVASAPPRRGEDDGVESKGGGHGPGAPDPLLQVWAAGVAVVGVVVVVGHVVGDVGELQ